MSRAGDLLKDMIEKAPQMRPASDMGNEKLQKEWDAIYKQIGEIQRDAEKKIEKLQSKLDDIKKKMSN